MTNSSSSASAGEELLRERDRVVRRLASMPLDDLPADRVLAAAQQLADRTAEATGGPRRTVPVLAPYALGDQITVLVGEVCAAAEDDTHDTHADTELLTQALQVLADLRRDLP